MKLRNISTQCNKTTIGLINKQFRLVFKVFKNKYMLKEKY